MPVRRPLLAPPLLAPLLIGLLSWTAAVGLPSPGSADQAPAEGTPAPETPATATREVSFEGLTLKIPAAWKKQPPANALRLGQFEIAGPSDEHASAELSVFHFGASDPASNVARWKTAFQAAGRSVKVVSGEFAAGKYVLADIRGTYNKPTGKANAGGFAAKTKPAEDHRMLAVMLLHEKRGAYFLKLVGPRPTVAPAAEAFRAAFGGDPAKEQAYPPPPSDE